MKWGGGGATAQKRVGVKKEDKKAKIVAFDYALKISETKKATAAFLSSFVRKKKGRKKGSKEVVIKAAEQKDAKGEKQAEGAEAHM